MLIKDAVSSEMMNIIKIIQNNSIFDNHILAGGTALALQIGHRTSTDIDLFTSEKQNAVSLTEFFIKNFKNCNIPIADDKYIQIFVNNIKIELVHDDYNVIINPVSKENIKLFDKKEISAMKLRAIQGRTKARDFIDIAYLLQEIPIKNMLELYKEKYGSVSDIMIKRTMLTKSKTIKDDEWLIGIKMLRFDIEPKDVPGIIEKELNVNNKSNGIGI